MAITPADRDLALAAASSRHDSFLEAVASLHETGYYVGLLVNGMTAYGRVSSDRAIAEVLDAENARAVARWKERDPTWSEVEDEFKDRWTRQIDEEEREHRELVERNSNVPSDEMSDDDTRAMAQDRAVALTLVDAKVFPPGAPALEVPVLRVQVAQVGAWWLVPIDEKGGVSFTHPG